MCSRKGMCGTAIGQDTTIFREGTYMLCCQLRLGSGEMGRYPMHVSLPTWCESTSNILLQL